MCTPPNSPELLDCMDRKQNFIKVGVNKNGQDEVWSGPDQFLSLLVELFTFVYVLVISFNTTLVCE